MKRVFNFLFCKRRAFHTPLFREPAFLPPDIQTGMTNSYRGAFFPNTLAVTGCLAVLLRLRYLRDKVSSSGPSADQQEEIVQAREELDLGSLTPFDPNPSSLATSACLAKDQNQPVLLMVKSEAKSPPDLSSIVHAQVFGDSNLRCITKLAGVDIIPKRGSRKSRRKTAKQNPHISAKKESETRKGPVRNEPVQESTHGSGKPCAVVQPETSTDEPLTNQEAVRRKPEADEQSYMHDQSMAPPVQSKKPRRRPNRVPRPPHRKRAQKPPQHASRRPEGNPGNCEDEEHTNEMPKVGETAERKESQAPSGSNEISPRLEVKKHRPRRKAFRRSKGGNAEQRTDRTHPAPGTTQGRKEEGHRKQPPRMHYGSRGSRSYIFK